MDKVDRATESEEGVGMALWEWALVAVATGCALLLGVLHLDLPSLWHDELVHVFVGRSIAETGWPTLPGRDFFPSYLVYNVLLAGVIKVFGDGAFAMRFPSVLAGCVNVVLLYFIVRRLFGRTVAVVTIFAFVFSPWNVAWARQARNYSLQATSYLSFCLLGWCALETKDKRAACWLGAGAVVAYCVGISASFHSILFLGSVGGYAILRCILSPPDRGRCGFAIGLCFVVGVLTIGGLTLNPNAEDQSAVFSTGIGGTLPDPQRLIRWAYVRWLGENLSFGVLLTAFLGTGLALLREKRRGLYGVLAFWVPLLILTFLIGYRRPRFVFFAFPFYVCLSSYAMVQLALFCRHYRRSVLHGLAALVIVLFGLRLGMSLVKLTGNSLAVAGGSDVTLARRHPQWAKPCAYVRERRTDEAVLTTTFLPVAYYVGHVDNWFPNRYQAWESQEAGMVGLGSLAALQAFVAEHPRGYYIAEYDRFEKNRHHGDLIDTLGAEVTWVQEHMERIEEASSRDVTVYGWGL